MSKYGVFFWSVFFTQCFSVKDAYDFFIAFQNLEIQIQIYNFKFLNLSETDYIKLRMNRKNGAEFQNPFLIKVMESLMDLIVQTPWVFSEVDFMESLRHENIRIMGVTISAK